MQILTGLCLTPIAAVLLAGNTFAQEGDRAAILALMQQAFDAVSSGNPDDWRAIQLAEGTSISLRPNPSGNSGEMRMRITTNEAEAVSASETDGNHENIERWTSDPTILIRGPIAAVWGEYEYWVDGEFSHCGIDSVQLVNVKGGWKIANWVWTVEKHNCPTEPSG